MTAKNVRSGMICLREPESFCEGLDTDVYLFIFLVWIAFCWYCKAFEYMNCEATNSDFGGTGKRDRQTERQ